MEAGFRSWNDDDNYQIDGVYANPGVLRKGTLITDTYSPSHSIRQATFALGPGEVFAFASEQPMAVAGIYDGVVYLRGEPTSDSDPDWQVKYWIYGPPPTRDDVGMRVFGAAGEVVFDSSWKVLNIKGFTSGQGSFSFPSSREYALMPEEVYYRVVKSSQYIGVQPNVLLALYRSITAHCGKIAGGTVTVEDRDVDRWAYVQSSTNQVGYVPPNWNTDTNNGVTTRYLVVDVTGH